MDGLRQVATDMAKTINYGFLFAGADFSIPDSEIQTDTVRTAYAVSLEDLYALADVNLTVQIESIGLIKPWEGAAYTPTTHFPSGTGPDIPLFRPGLSGPDDRSVRA